MPFRPLTEDEVRAAAQETLTHGDWFTMRDLVVKLFPSAVRFTYCFSSEYNDEGYDIRQKLDSVTGLVNGDEVVLVMEGSLTDAGDQLIQSSTAWVEHVANYNYRYGEPDTETFFYDALYEMDDASPMIHLADGDESDIITADVKTGPQRRFNQLFVAVSE